MDPVQALAMGVLQGLAEFLPISSSAHLVLLPWLFGWQDPGLSFDVALHLGTLVAVVAFFWRDWADLLGGLGRTTARKLGLRGQSAPRKLALSGQEAVPDLVVDGQEAERSNAVDDQATHLFWLLVIACIPGAIVGALAESAAETSLRNPALVASLMIGLGVLLLIAEAIGSRSRLLEHVGLNDSVLIGLSQALAVMPGVSRSGITITTGLFRGLTRDAAARFSFLLSTPIIAGAGLFNLRHIVKGGIPADERMAFVIGVVTAAVVGFLAIKVLLSYLQRNSLRIFAYYRFAAGAGIFALLLMHIR